MMEVLAFLDSLFQRNFYFLLFFVSFLKKFLQIVYCIVFIVFFDLEQNQSLMHCVFVLMVVAILVFIDILSCSFTFFFFLLTEFK